MIKKIIIGLSFLLLGSLAQTALAIDSQELPDVKEGVVSIIISEPEKLVGYTVGDVIERKVELTIKAPYKLIETSLPIVGYEKRYRGQLIGIELKSMTHTKDEDDASTVHTIELAYQVFTNNVVAKNASLGPEYLQLINTKNPKDLVKYRIPSLSIAISPISIFGAVKVENNMSQFRPPLLLSDARETQWLKGSLIVLALSLVVLLYIVGKHAWLPRMGGAFAKAFRSQRKLPNNFAGLQGALSQVHTAFNTTAGYSVFSNNLNHFLSQYPQFKPAQSAIDAFFALSRQVHFEQNTPQDIASAKAWLLKFTRQCRDCERGLIPNIDPKQPSPTQTKAVGA